MNKKLEELIEMMPFMKELSGQDAEINIWDTEGVDIGCFPSSEFKMPFHVGFQIHDKSDPIFDVMKTGKKQFVKVPAEVFGEIIEGFITPVVDEKEVVGCVTYVFSTEQTQKITDSSTGLKNTLEDTSNQLMDVSENMEELANRIKEAHDMSMNINSELDSIKKIIHEIQNNTKHLNILALNTSIEAARVGASGKGFTVVAGEMAKFSKISTEATMKINQALTNIVGSLGGICTVIEKTSQIATQQTDGITTINEKFSMVNSFSNDLVELCKNF